MISLYKFITEAVSEKTIQKFKQTYKRNYDSVNHTINPKHRTLVIINCSQTKSDECKEHSQKAIDAYTGQGTDWIRDAYKNDNIDIMICSGGYGLISADTKIDYYDDVFHEFPDSTRKEMSDFLKYNEDLVKLIKKGNYNRIVFAISSVWSNLLDYKEISEAAGDKCELIDLTNEDTPAEYTKIPLFSISTLRRLQAGRFNCRYKFIQLLSHEMKNNGDNIDIKKFAKKCSGDDLKE